MKPLRVAVCGFDELEDPGARGFELVLADGSERAAFVVRRDGRVFAYLDACPHTGSRLEWKPDAFLTRDRSLIMCSVHGAIFEIDSGICVGGPCVRMRLGALRTEVVEGTVFVEP